MHKTFYLILSIAVIFFLIILYSYLGRKNDTFTLPSNTPAQKNPSTSTSTNAESEFTTPLDRASERVTKKKFGTYVTPQNSPVQPERFQGYHTGIDFETFPEEQNSDVPIKAICTGKLIVKEYAQGYGGIAVQSCAHSNEPITVIYGHLKLDSIKAKVVDTLNKGDTLGILGKGFSSETDGERKHLHLGIHRGSEVNIRGYVATSDELSSWLNPQQLLGF